ncbi:hypothetical protein L1887_04995 [Cichorium endivia]|nr:hypothetical protein L1887_04995 [Cichorium endivia]
MEMEVSKCMKESEDEHKTGKKVDRFFFLPDDILLDILKRVPDVFLRYKAKYVCRRWFNIITNMILLDHASFIHCNFRDFTTRLVDIREERLGLQVKVQDPDIPRIGKIRSWCNEFLLISDNNRKGSLYVYNQITKEGWYLPQHNASCCSCGNYAHKCGVALSFDRFKGIYKVAHLFMGRTIKCHILILGRNITTRAFLNWKKIELPYMNEGKFIWGDPVSVKGRYLNWRIYGSNDLVSVDMVKEEICIISPPVSINHGMYISFFVMGGFLAVYVGGPCDKAEIWVLKDFHKLKWEKLQLRLDSNWFFTIYFIYGVISKRYIIGGKPMDGLYSYDLKSGVIKELGIHMGFSEGFVVH